MPRHFANRPTTDLLTELRADCLELRRKQQALKRNYSPAAAQRLSTHYAAIDRLLAELTQRGITEESLFKIVQAWRQAALAHQNREHNAAAKLQVAADTLDTFLAA